MKFQILGPVQVLDGERVVPVPAGRVRTLLAVLLLRANHVVTVPELIDRLWDEQSPPDNPRAAIQTYVRRLRQTLPEALVHTRPHGYLINVDTTQLDLSTFRDLVQQATRAAGPAERVHLLQRAIALWRGQPLADLSSESLAMAIGPRLVEERLHAHEQLIEAKLELGHHVQTIAELTELTTEHPLRERFWAQLMLALHRSGRQADALAAYRTASHLLADQLGLDPGEELRRVHQSVLTADSNLIPASPTQTVWTTQSWTTQSWITQCQLPMEVADFVGRKDLTDEIQDMLTADDEVPVVVVSGSPGVGKTALGVRVAHRLRPGFPDGQWYVRLHGAGGNPRDPADVLAELLRTSGMDDAAIPEALDARAAIFRARLADRRVLLLLDDSGSAEQVRPLLPGAAGSAVLVTSRPELSGLTALEGGRGIHLGVLDPDEAGALLVHIIGAQAVRADPAAAAELVELCGSLPLALRIAAANLAARRGRSITRYVTELRSGNRLAKLAVSGDPQVAVRAAFDLSFVAIDPQPQRLFRLLGVIPGVDFCAAAAAALLDTDRDRAEHRLDQLAAANLLQRHAADRYLFHDLLRLYAAELAESDPDREAAWHRLCDWYLATANAAVQFDYLPLVRLPGHPSVDSRPFCDAKQARKWLDTERANLAAAALRAADAGQPEFAWLLINTMGRYLYESQHVPEWRAAAEGALRAAQAHHNRLAEGSMHHFLGGLHAILRDMRTALAHEQVALQCYREAGQRLGELATLGNLASSYEELGQAREAADLLDQAIGLFQALGMPYQANTALALMGRVHMRLGELDNAIRRATECLTASQDKPDYARRAALITRGGAYRLSGEYGRASADLTAAIPIPPDQLDVSCQCEVALLHADTGQFDLAFHHAMNGLWASRRNRQTWGEADALTTLGELHRLRGRPDLAAAHHQHTLRIATAHGYRSLVAEAHVGLARTSYDAAEPDAARHHAQQAFTIAQQLELRITECRALLLLAAISRDKGDVGEASHYAEQARRIQDETGYRPPAHASYDARRDGHRARG